MSPKKKEKELRHHHVISLKLTDLELEILDRGAQTAGLCRSEYLRKLLLDVPMEISYEIVADMVELRR